MKVTAVYSEQSYAWGTFAPTHCYLNGRSNDGVRVA